MGNFPYSLQGRRLDPLVQQVVRQRELTAHATGHVRDAVRYIAPVGLAPSGLSAKPIARAAADRRREWTRSGATETKVKSASCPGAASFGSKGGNASTSLSKSNATGNGRMESRAAPLGTPASANGATSGPRVSALAEAIGIKSAIHPNAG